MSTIGQHGGVTVGFRTPAVDEVITRTTRRVDRRMIVATRKADTTIAILLGAAAPRPRYAVIVKKRIGAESTTPSVHSPGVERLWRGDLTCGTTARELGDRDTRWW